MTYKWGEEDDILVFYLFRYPENKTVTKKVIAEYQAKRMDVLLGKVLTQRVNSIRWRLGNFRWADTGGKGKKSASHVAKLTKRVHKEWKDKPHLEHEQKCKKILTMLEL